MDVMIDDLLALFFPIVGTFVVLHYLNSSFDRELQDDWLSSLDRRGEDESRRH